MDHTWGLTTEETHSKTTGLLVMFSFFSRLKRENWMVSIVPSVGK